MQKRIIIKYAELTTKKQNREYFINILYNNIKEKLVDFNLKVIKEHSIMYIDADINIFDDIVKKLIKVFGIHSIIIADVVNSNIIDIKNKSLEIINELNIKTFKIETKRSNKKFEIPSMEVSRMVGGHILKNANNLKVDVHNPEILLKILIRDDKTYIYREEIKGLGGYPVGSAGRALVMLSGGIDSPVAAFLALKRGIKIECVYFESPPHTSPRAKDKVLKLVNCLLEYQPSIKLHVVSLTKIQEEIYKNLDYSYMITILRRMMYRISEKLALKNKCKIIITGENISQVASQTLDSLSVINSVIEMSVIRPVVCFDKVEIIDLAKKINTYDISILPFEDCCTIFVPKHPVIHPKKEIAIKEENKIPFLEYIEETVENTDTLKIKKEDTFF